MVIYNMPYKKVNKKFMKKFRKGGKYHKRGKMSMLVNKASKTGGFPDSYFTPLTFNYVGTYAMGAGTNPCSAFAFAATDPTKNNAISPQGWSILKQVYDVYLVHAIKVSVSFYNKSATVPFKCFITMIDQDDNNYGTVPNLSLVEGTGLTQTPYCKVGNLSIAGGGHDNVTLTFVMKIAKFSGKKKVTPADERNLGNTGSVNSAQSFSQPTYKPNIIYGIISADNSNIASNAVYVSEKVTWYTQFTERLGPLD